MNEKVLRLQGRAVRASGDEKRAVGRGAFADYDAGAHGWASEKKRGKAFDRQNALGDAIVEKSDRVRLPRQTCLFLS